MSRPFLLALAGAAVALSACSGTFSELNPDGGVATADGNDLADAGDAGDETTDAGDAGTRGTPDAGLTPDAGTPGSAGCSTGNGIASGEQTFTLNSRQRKYLLYLPNGYTRNRAWPVVFALHGNGGNVSYWNGTAGDRNIRGTVDDEAILVIAEAIGGNWRDYAEPPASWPARMEEELEYFDTILQSLNTELCVDEKELFSMGFSGGGSFSGVLGCRRKYIRAIASGGSVIYFDKATCVNKPAAWTTMGQLELDERGTTFRDYFREQGGCHAISAATAPSPCVAYDGCNAATPNHYCQHAGDHVWPSFGTAAAWQFFKKFVD